MATQARASTVTNPKLLKIWVFLFKNMKKFEALCQVISSSINLLFLKSGTAPNTYFIVIKDFNNSMLIELHFISNKSFLLCQLQGCKTKKKLINKLGNKIRFFFYNCLVLYPAINQLLRKVKLLWTESIQSNLFSNLFSPIVSSQTYTYSYTE